MKLLNQSLLYISLFMLMIVGVWSVVFYKSTSEEIKESVDKGLDNYRRQIIFQAHQDTGILKRVEFSEGFYAIREIEMEEALKMKDVYADTMIYVPKKVGESELEPFRLLTTAFEDEGRYYHLRVINTMIEKGELFQKIFRNTILLYIILVLSIILANNLVLKRIWKPFYHFLNQVRKYRLQSNQKIPEIDSKIREFVSLQEATQILITHNKSIYEQQKQFIGNASHELQTPLAIILNKLELLLEDENLKNNQASEVEKMLTILERLIRLNKSLLLLSKIENRQFPDNETLLVNDIVKKALSEIEDVSKYRNIKLTLREVADCSTEINPALAEILISNLLRNAVFHSKPATEVLITIDEKHIVFSNEGESELDGSIIFNRFEKLDANSENSGLGLSIVQAICRLYGYRVSYSFLNYRHIFKLSL